MDALRLSGGAGIELPAGNSAKIAVLAQLFARISREEQAIDRIGAALTLISQDLCLEFATPDQALEAIDALAADLRDSIRQQWGLPQ